jgi:hypothetical protein
MIGGTAPPKDNMYALNKVSTSTRIASRFGRLSLNHQSRPASERRSAAIASAPPAGTLAPSELRRIVEAMVG